MKIIDFSMVSEGSKPQEKAKVEPERAGFMQVWVQKLGFMQVWVQKLGFMQVSMHPCQAKKVSAGFRRFRPLGRFRPVSNPIP